MTHRTSVFTNHLARDFVESCGAILFDISTPQTLKVCLLHHIKKDEWLLAKGRRNCGESRKSAAVREVMEETGYKSHLHPVKMTTRAPSVSEPADVQDVPRSYPDLMEPFMLMTREIEGTSSMKLIWWYIAVLDDSSNKLAGETDFRPEFFLCEDALKQLTFETDRAVLVEAIRLIRG